MLWQVVVLFEDTEGTCGGLYDRCGASYHEDALVTALFVCLFDWLMVFNAAFNNISVISSRSVLLLEEIGGPEEYHRPVASRWQILSHNVVHLSLIDVGFKPDIELIANILA